MERSSPGRSPLDTSHDAAGRKGMLQPGPGRPERPQPCGAEVATAEEADRFLGYWRAWGDHLPLEVIVSPHRAVVAPLASYLWTLREQRLDLILTVAVPELVDRHWWHRIMYEPVGGVKAARPAEGTWPGARRLR